MKLKRCEVCSKRRFGEEHHVVPLTLRPDNKSTAFLCTGCHDMIDRTSLEDWCPFETWEGFTQLWGACGPEGRLLLLKMFKIVCHGAAVARDASSSSP